MKNPTKQQVEELNYPKLMPDEAIDASDIPEQTNWEKAVVRRFYSKKPKTSAESDNESYSSKAKNSLNSQRMIN